jgi:hypothetical protein
MDHYTADILCSKSTCISHSLVLGQRNIRLQVALFLLCMPVSAAPLEATAVAGQSTHFCITPCAHANCQDLSLLEFRYTTSRIAMILTSSHLLLSVCSHTPRRVFPTLRSWTSTAPVFRLFRRGNLRPTQGSGWQAVATEEVEMSLNSRR